MANEITEAMELIKQAQAKFKEVGLISNIDVWFHSVHNNISESKCNELADEFVNAMDGAMKEKFWKYIEVQCDSSLEVNICREGVTEDDESNFLFQD